MDARARARRVVLTGAAGGIGRAVTPLLPGTWELVTTDRRADGAITFLDATDLDACALAFAGADAVVHLAGNPDPSASWSDLRAPNVEGVHAVAVAAGRSGVRRLVLASSVQAVSARPEAEQIRAGDPPRPANLYGATKAWAEAIGSWIAATTPMTVVALRIGYFSPEPPAGEDDTPPNRSAWLSRRDAAELIRAAVEGPVTGFAVVCGLSANRHSKALYGDAERALGYRPVDDAWAAGEPS
jgi:nucleoside-diphosphate-sugar epimerase